MPRKKQPAPPAGDVHEALRTRIIAYRVGDLMDDAENSTSYEEELAELFRHGLPDMEELTLDELKETWAGICDARDGRHRCGNCDKVFWGDRLDPNIPDLFERTEPGGTVPTGECLDCRSLCYPVDNFDFQDGDKEEETG